MRSKTPKTRAPHIGDYGARTYTPVTGGASGDLLPPYISNLVRDRLREMSPAELKEFEQKLAEMKEFEQKVAEITKER